MRKYRFEIDLELVSKRKELKRWSFNKFQKIKSMVSFIKVNSFKGER